MKKVFDFLLFLRPLNLMMVFAIFWAFEYFIFEPIFASQGFGLGLKSFQLDLLALNTVLVAVIGYLINDWYDQPIDKLNKPNRFLIKYSVSSLQFFTILGLLIMLVLFLAAFLAWSLKMFHWLWIYPFFTFIMWYYAANLKLRGLIGNIVISFSIAVIPALILYAEYSSYILLKTLNEQAASQLITHLAILSVLIFLSNMARELVKDVEDANGDKAHNSSSFFLRYGLKKTKQVVLTAVLAVLVLEMTILIYSTWVTQEFIYAGCTVLFGSVLLAIKAMKSSEKKHFSKLSLGLKLLMLIGLVQVLFLNPR